MKKVEIQDINDIIGKTLAEAETYAKSKNLILREVLIDGRPVLCTDDLRFNRVNIATMNGKVIQICDVG